MTKPILISGMQPTGRLHLENYLGALKHFVDLTNTERYRPFFFIADLHSLTEKFDTKKKREQVLDLVVNYLAAGIDPKNATIFLQSAIQGSTELAWILSTLTPLGELRRMTQFKDKSEHDPHNVNVGLFSYPLLMAADILLYDATHIPVGEDQLQHLELARTLARKFNARFGHTFTEPQPLLTEVPRLMSLDNTTSKMSKSRPEGCLFIDDTPTVIREKVKHAVTDSGKEVRYDEARKPAISNLMLLYASFSGLSLQQIEKKYHEKGYGDFKRDCAEVIISALTPFQKKKKTLLKKPRVIHTILARGSAKASLVAGKKLLEIKKKIGLL